MYYASQMLEMGFEIIIHRDDFEQLKQIYGYYKSEDDLIEYGIDDVLYIKVK